jgi:hypothetical protein
MELARGRVHPAYVLYKYSKNKISPLTIKDHMAIAIGVLRYWQA